MKRLVILVTAVAMVIAAAPKADARTGAMHYYDGGWHWVSYREPVIRVGVGYNYGYGCWYPRNAQNSYPQSSILSIIGLPDYNSEQYWAYHNKIVDRDKEQSQSTGCPYVSDQQLLERANQAGRIQKLEEKIAELEAKLNAKPTK